MCKYSKNVNDRRQINDLKFYRQIFLGLTKLKLILCFISSKTESFVFKKITDIKTVLIGIMEMTFSHKHFCS